MNFLFLLACSSAILAGITALLVAFSSQRSLPHWFFVAGMSLLALESLCNGFAADAVLPDEFHRWKTLVLIIRAFLPAAWLCFSLTYARGNAPGYLTRNRLVLGAALLVPVGLAIGFRRWLIADVGQSESGGWILQLGGAGVLLNILFLIGAVLVLMHLERTFRASVGTMRWRIKFMILGLGVLFVVRIYTSSQALLFRATDLSLQGVNAAALLIACLLIGRSLLRTGHFEVKVYPSQAVLHSSFTVLVAGIYLLIVGLLAKLISEFGGDVGFPLKAFLILVALVLLTIVLLSDRVRLYTSRWVSRHFQRPVYDYRSVWRTVTEGTARCVEQTQLCSAIVRLVSEVFQSLSVTVWLVDERREQLVFGASTALSEARADKLALDPADAAEVMAALARHPEPIDMETSKEPWAAALRRSHPDEFRKGGNRVCVPMIAAGELLGVLNVGDRVSGAPLSLQDFDLLKSVSDQAAASLLNIRLSQQLSQARQLEAFQAMSAFFVHDLKNTASTLSLMLQNLPVHYQDPDFREDALRGISLSVTHINDLINRLNMLRHELTIQPVECDLNELVSENLKGQEQLPGVELVKELRPIPKVHVDPDQIQKVLTNLLLNARDALSGGGQIRVETNQQNAWVVLTVTDNGCGISPEFIRDSLFRPFQTTKKRGIGIGMFHCKMIVEAHRGRIEVESTPHQGTTFRVLLPLAP
jgi:putative PEP-CTERM system histidine kinase